MILINSTVALGDCITSFHLTRVMIEQTPEPVYLHFTNQDVGALFPKKYGQKPLTELPLDGNQRVIRFDKHDFVHGRLDVEHNNIDFGAAMFVKFGLEPRYYLPEIEYPEDSTVPAYDFVLAPCVLNNAGKNMSMEFWQQLIEAIRERYKTTPCVIGTSRLPIESDLQRIEPDISRFKGADYREANLMRHYSGVDYFWDEPLIRVAQLMANVRKCFISVDSGPSHLMRAIRRPHVELFRWCIISMYGENGFTVRDESEKEITIPQVMQHIESTIA